MEEPVTLALNLAGTFAFGLSGGILAVRKQMDLFGVLVLSVTTGLGGGIMRDILLGHIPPSTLSDWRYLASAGLAGLLVFARFSKVIHHTGFITTFDAVGLSTFTVTGTTIALAAGLEAAPAALLGMLTGVGGGILRDVLAAEVPLIFRSEIYAVASLLGAIIIILASQAGFLEAPVEIVAAVATFSLRMVSVQRGWKIPVARPRPDSEKP
ncbi:trimeric intracellular cation channel family protein [Candidatus Bathyarchaeota archaeon]|nr:trimeric intracellular cation channel family protein [Candidatus Bathyarchaeota archaeon]